jgi:LacI family transcriptional regulator
LAVRFAGYRQALERAGLDIISLPDPPTALFTGQNLVTIGAVKTLRQVDMLDKIALVGFGDLRLAARGTGQW